VAGKLALLLLPKLKQYVAAVADGTCAKPQNRSFEVIRESCMDNLLAANLHFFHQFSQHLVERWHMGHGRNRWTLVEIWVTLC